MNNGLLILKSKQGWILPFTLTIFFSFQTISVPGGHPIVGSFANLRNENVDPNAKQYATQAVFTEYGTVSRNYWRLEVFCVTVMTSR